MCAHWFCILQNTDCSGCYPLDAWLSKIMLSSAKGVYVLQELITCWMHRLIFLSMFLTWHRSKRHVLVFSAYGEIMLICDSTLAAVQRHILLAETFKSERWWWLSNEWSSCGSMVHYGPLATSLQYVASSYWQKVRIILYLIYLMSLFTCVFLICHVHSAHAVWMFYS